MRFAILLLLAITQCGSEPKPVPAAPVKEPELVPEPPPEISTEEPEVPVPPAPPIQDPGTPECPTLAQPKCKVTVGCMWHDKDKCVKDPSGG